jgi:hypothetical protein
MSSSSGAFPSPKPEPTTKPQSMGTLGDTDLAKASLDSTEPSWKTLEFGSHMQSF